MSAHASLASPDSADELNGPAVRLRLVACKVEHARGAMSRAIAEFEGRVDGERIEGRKEGSTCPGGDLRLAALATMDAIQQATSSALRLELIGVKPIRAFDTNIVVVAAIAHHGGSTIRVVGAAIADEDPLVGTARATLHAVNRLASPLLTRITA
jgi:hypothetical protein